MKILRRAQTIMEYVLLISVITAAVLYMLPRVKRTTQSLIKTAADQIGDQAGSEQAFDDPESGYLASMDSSTKSQINNFRRDVNGNIDQGYNEVVTTGTHSQTNMGWSSN